jgi:2-dehydropantoate 2-reductase
VVYGAGAIGGTIGGLLHRAGHAVVLVARGAHLDAMRRDGLRLQTPDGEEVLPVPVGGSPAEVAVADGDVVILSMKTQDTAAALEELAAAAPADMPVVCAQNGVENERLALRSFERVYGMCVKVPATHLEPGVVQASGTPMAGILDIGRYPSGTDDVVDRLAADLIAAGFVARRDDDVMRAKYRKLLMNLANAVEAACGREERTGELSRLARREAAAVLAAAGIESGDRDQDRRDFEQMRIVAVGGTDRTGGSTWQSMARGSSSTEVDYLNGEIVLLGRLWGVPTPVNELLRSTVNEMVRDGHAPGTIAAEDLLAQL